MEAAGGPCLKLSVFDDLNYAIIKGVGVDSVDGHQVYKCKLYSGRCSTKSYAVIIFEVYSESGTIYVRDAADTEVFRIEGPIKGVRAFKYVELVTGASLVIGSLTNNNMTDASGSDVIMQYTPRFETPHHYVRHIGLRTNVAHIQSSKSTKDSKDIVTVHLAEPLESVSKALILTMTLKLAVTTFKLHKHLPWIVQQQRRAFASSVCDTRQSLPGDMSPPCATSSSGATSTPGAMSKQYATSTPGATSRQCVTSTPDVTSALVTMPGPTMPRGLDKLRTVADMRLVKVDCHTDAFHLVNALDNDRLYLLRLQRPGPGALIMEDQRTQEALLTATNMFIERSSDLRISTRCRIGKICAYDMFDANNNRLMYAVSVGCGPEDVFKVFHDDVSDGRPVCHLQWCMQEHLVHIAIGRSMDLLRKLLIIIFAVKLSCTELY